MFNSYVKIPEGIGSTVQQFSNSTFCWTLQQLMFNPSTRCLRSKSPSLLFLKRFPQARAAEKWRHMENQLLISYNSPKQNHNCFVGETSIFYPSNIQAKSGFSWLNHHCLGDVRPWNPIHCTEKSRSRRFFQTHLLQDFAIAGPWTLDDYGWLLWLTMINNSNAIVIYHNYSHL